MFCGRIIPIKREGNIVFARPLRRGEMDTGEVIQLNPGDKIVIPAGELTFHVRDIDECFNPMESDGYRAVANTVWTWYSITHGAELDFFLFLFALARRTDAAHAVWKLAVEALEQARTESGISQRLTQFNALAAAEVAVISLGRCYYMVDTLVQKYCGELQPPENIKKTRDAVGDMRNAFEHIDERADGKINREKRDSSALTIFDQPHFVSASILQYQNHRLHFEKDVINALVDCRELILKVIETRTYRKSENKHQEYSKNSAKLVHRDDDLVRSDNS